MFIFNPNYTRAQTSETMVRLVRLKKAADRVYDYYEWLSSDYRHGNEGEENQKEMVGLRQDVKTALFFDDNQDPLVNYFIACVLFAVYVSHQAGTPSGTPCPVDRSMLDSMYNAETVSKMLVNADRCLISYATGTFMLEGDGNIGNLGTIELARKGTIVMADQELTETISLRTLFQAEEVDDDLDEEQQGQLFLRELLRLENESKLMTGDVSVQSSDK